MRLLTSIKTLIVVCVVVACVILLGKLYDSEFNSMAFVNYSAPIEYDWSEISNRNVASNDINDLGLKSFEDSNEYKNIFNGLWTVLEFYDANGSAPERVDQNVTLYVNEDFTIQLASDENFIFSVSEVIEHGKEYILENVNIKNEKVRVRRYLEVQDKKLSKSFNKETEEESPKGMSNLKDGDYVIVDATNAKFSGVRASGDYVVGGLSLIGNTIQGVELAIQYPTREKNKKEIVREQTVNISLADILDGGQFSYYCESNEGLEVECTGVITQNGENGVKLRLVGGIHDGTYISFETLERRDERLKAQTYADSYGDNRQGRVDAMMDQRLQEQEDASNQRKGEQYIDEDYEQNLGHDDPYAQDNNQEEEGEYQEDEGFEQQHEEYQDEEFDQQYKEDQELEYTGEETAYSVSPKEMAKILKRSGFSFSSNNNARPVKRDIASQK